MHYAVNACELKQSVDLRALPETLRRGMCSSRRKTASNSPTSVCRDGSKNETTTPVKHTYLLTYCVCLVSVDITSNYCDTA